MWSLKHLISVAATSLCLLQNSTPAGEPKNVPNKKPGASADGPANLAPEVPATAPVITVRGLCDEGAPKTDVTSCARRMSRAQFEILVGALNPDGRSVPQAARHNLARTYADYLAIEVALRKEGIGDTPEFRALMEWTRLRTMADFYRHHLEEKYRTPPPAEIEAYYQKHLADYERVALARILVPRENPSAPDKNGFDKKALEAARAAQARAARGEDPSQIQKDVYAALGLASPPPAHLGNRRRAEMIAEEAAAVFALKTGEVSPVLDEIKSYVIYKVTGQNTVPLEEARTEIGQAIYRQKFRDSMKLVLDAFPAEFNEQYFGPETAAPSPKPPVAPASSPVN